MRAGMVIELKVVMQALLERGNRVIVLQVNVFIFDCAPEVFDKDIVQGPTPPIHADCNIRCLQAPGEDLRALHENPILHRREWYPRDLFRELTEDAKLSPGHVDQMVAMWRDLFGVKQYPFKEDSPFDELLL